ncbi:MAG: putative glutamate--cysteine ligase, partial [Rivularia sp. ALOHA_DT_140]|nr:putative glutamate--cysteine ligase [Rivularia sp. ALOHA_DT_140]
LELRICDLVTEAIALLAITALLEARLLQLINNPNLDPLIQSSFSPEELIAITTQNEIDCAQNSLDAQLTHWVDGRTITARDWINELYQPLSVIAKHHGFGCFLSPLQKILREGNQAQRWLQLHRLGVSSRNVITQAINSIQERELELEDKLCSSLVA